MSSETIIFLANLILQYNSKFLWLAFLIILWNILELAFELYEVIVDSGFVLIDYHLIESRACSLIQGPN